MKPIPAVLVDPLDPTPIPVIIYAFVHSKAYGTKAVIATAAGTFRTADLEDLRWHRLPQGAPVSTDFAETASRLGTFR